MVGLSVYQPVHMKPVFLSITLLLSLIGVGQTDSLLLMRRASFNAEVNTIDWQQAPVRQHYFKPNHILVPMAALLYGFTSLHNEELQELNVSTKQEIREESPHFHTSIDNYLQFAPAASVFALSAAGVKTTHSFRDRAILLGMSTAIMAGTVFSLKKITGQWRPDGSGNNSFPSGHTATAFSGAAFMYQELKGQSPLLSYSGYAMATGVGVMRMYNNKHWLSDVIAGAGLGMLSTRVSYWLFDKMKKTKSTPSF